jgi:hypothetical protein
MTRHDPGGKVRLPMLPGMTGAATFSADETRRYTLSRRWGDETFALWIGMNPSTASEMVDDPTVRREVIRTSAGLSVPGHEFRPGSYYKVNIMDYRATEPERLLEIDHPSSPWNLLEIGRLAKKAEIVIAAWGAVHPRLRSHAYQVSTLLRRLEIPVYCLGLTKEGFPRHPLYIAAGVPLQRFDLGGMK